MLKIIKNWHGEELEFKKDKSIKAKVLENDLLEF